MISLPRASLALSLLCTFAFAGVAASRADEKDAAAVAPSPTQDEDPKTLYALGLAVARSLDVFSLTEKEVEHVLAGIKDAALKRTLKVDFDAFKPKLQALARKRASRLIDEEAQAADGVLAKAAAEAGAEKTASGLIYRELKAGTGAHPKATDTVRVHYAGTLRDGSTFDSSIARGEPASFPLNRVVPCWTEGVQKMKVGAKAKLTCPSKIAYGDRGSPPNIRPGAVLTFEVELLAIEAPAAPEAPNATEK